MSSQERSSDCFVNEFGRRLDLTVTFSHNAFGAEYRNAT